MVTLTLRVERALSGVRLDFHHSDVDASDVGAMLTDLESGTYVQAECEYVPGVGMRAVQVLAVTAYSQPSARTSIRALVEKREYQRALDELEAFGELRVRVDPTFLMARACALIGFGDQENSTRDLRGLLALPGVTSLDIHDVFARFTERFGVAAIDPLAHELVKWVAARRPARPLSFLTAVSPLLWPLDLLLAGLDEAIASDPPDPTRVRVLLEAARSTASLDPRVRTLWAQAASRGLTAGRMSDPP